MENISIRADCIWHRRISDRGMIQMHPFRVDSKPALSDRIKVGTNTKLTCVSAYSVNAGAGGIKLQEVLDRHAGSLNLKSVIVEMRNSSDVGALIIIEPSPVVLGFQ